MPSYQLRTRHTGGLVTIMPWVLVLVSLLTPLCLKAQAPGAFAGVGTGDMVRVRTSGGQVLAGRFATSSLSLPALASEGVAPVALGEVDSLWVRGSRAKVGA